MESMTLALGDGMTIARRNIIRMRRIPELVMGALVQPVFMIVMFGYVFGGSIQLSSGSYREFMVGGIFATILTFGAMFTGAGLAEDMTNGVIDRFRTLPMSRSAVIFGRTVSDIVLNAMSLVVMAAVGLLVGWRIRGGVVDAATAAVLLLAFAFALSWVMAYVGLSVRSVEVVNNVAMTVIFPVTFIANTIVPSDNLPPVLQTIAEWNPVSSVTQASRELFGNIPAGTPEPTAWPLQNPVIYTLGWIVLIIAVFAPLSVRKYNTSRTA